MRRPWSTGARGWAWGDRVRGVTGAVRVLLNALETRVDVKNPVGMVLAFRDRVADYATVAQG